jgi:hypothetical protein
VIALLAVPGRLLGWFPVHRRTVGDAARLVAALKAPAPEPGKRAWTREEVSLAIDRLFVETTGVREFTDRSMPLDGGRGRLGPAALADEKPPPRPIIQGCDVVGGILLKFNF